MSRPVVEAAVVQAPRRAPSKRDCDSDSKVRNEVQAAAIADHIRRVVDEAPPLTVEQRDRLAILLRGPATEETRVAAQAPGAAIGAGCPKRKAGP